MDEKQVFGWEKGLSLGARVVHRFEAVFPQRCFKFFRLRLTMGLNSQRWLALKTAAIQNTGLAFIRATCAPRGTAEWHVKVDCVC